MVNDYWRISYKGIGIYEVLKKEIWNTSEFPKREWENFKKSNAFIWLKTPNTYSKNSYSYFTELGYNLFIKNTYPIRNIYSELELDENSTSANFALVQKRGKQKYYKKCIIL